MLHLPEKPIALNTEPDRFFDKPTAWFPRGQFLLLKPTIEPEITSGGIVVPDSSRRKASSGFVNKIGADLQPEDFGIGDEVFFEKHTEIYIRLDDNDEEAFLIAASQILLQQKYVKLESASDTPSP